MEEQAIQTGGKSFQPLLPKNFSSSNVTPQLVTQGAEGLLYRSTYLLPSIPCALKYRPSKPYRHPILDLRLTKHRILSEARVLVKCRREGVAVPAIYALDEMAGWLMLEWIEGDVVRVKLNHWLAQRKELALQHLEVEKEVVGLMNKIGSAVGSLHAVGVIHGDLTTSNLMLAPSRSRTSDSQDTVTESTLAGEVILIDFGLATQSTQDEDRAVDLYVLERAFGSTHPGAEHLFGELLVAYGRSFKGANVVLKKLEDVRMRGRKRSMLG